LVDGTEDSFDVVYFDASGSEADEAADASAAASRT
jgi:hypothetical protein